jgi:heme-degrading monooxygenase HmoA
VFQNGAVTEVWTHGTWTVTPGRESDFVRAWEELGDWTVRAFPGAHGTLLRDTERPNVFISFGPWPDRDTAARWRASADFQTHLAAIRETLERFDPLLLEHVATKH